MEKHDQSPESGASLVKYFGLTTGIILLVSSIIGSGVYKKVAPMALDLQSPKLVLLAWVLAGIVTLLGVLTVAEVAMKIPKSGGPFVYLKELYGEKAAYTYGWSSFITIQSASTAAISFVAAQSLNAVWPLPALSEAWEKISIFGIIFPFDNFGVKLAAVGFILILTFVNTRGVHQGGRLSNIITVVVLGSLLAIVLGALTSSLGSAENVTANAATYPPTSFSEGGGFMKSMFLAMLAAFWAYEGWINIGFVGDEIKDPNRNIPRILILGMLVITTIYLLVNFAYLYVMPVDEMLGLYAKYDANGNFLLNKDGTIQTNDNFIAAVEVMRKFAGQGGAWAISLLIIITTLGCTNSTILTSGRIYYAMAKAKLFFRSAAVVHPVYHTPNNALWIFATWACVLVFSGSFEQLTSMLVFAQFIFYSMVVAGVFILRKRYPKPDGSYRTLGYPVVPALFLLFCLGLLVNTLINKPESLIGLLLIALGIPFYFLFREKPEKKPL